MGFKATEAVEELTYDFTPHITGSAAQGKIPEPSSKQIEQFRNAIVGSVKEAGLDPTALTSGKFSFEQMDDLLAKADSVEKATVAAVADITGIAHSTLDALPFRVKAAFLGWITGEFLNPEA